MFMYIVIFSCNFGFKIYTNYMGAFKNTPTKGKVRLIIFRDNSEEKNAWYGTALDFNIVVSSNTKEKAHRLLIEAIEGYVHVANNIKGLNDFSTLNQKPEKIYLDLWKSLIEDKEITSPYHVEFFGLQTIHA